MEFKIGNCKVTLISVESFGDCGDYSSEPEHETYPYYKCLIEHKHEIISSPHYENMLSAIGWAFRMLKYKNGQ